MNYVYDFLFTSKTKQNMLLISLHLFFMVMIQYCKSECNDPSNIRDIVRADFINEYTLQTASGITDGSTYIDQYLKSCLFRTTGDAKQICDFQCLINPDCMAIYKLDSHGCEHCIPNVDTGGRNISQIPKAHEVGIRLDTLEKYIDGNCFSLCGNYLRFENVK